MEFPFMNDGKLYEAFPMIMLYLNNGERIDIDYFGTRTLSFIPTRFMQKDDNAIIPIVKYLSKFKTEKEVAQIFMNEVSLEMKDYHKNVFCIGGNQFVNWDNVCKIEVLMKQYVYCYDNPIFEGNSKHVKSEGVARFISIANDFEIDDKMTITETKSKDEINFDFLKCAAFE